jgi:DNA polymerase III alpha subunit
MSKKQSQLTDVAVRECLQAAESRVRERKDSGFNWESAGLNDVEAFRILNSNQLAGVYLIGRAPLRALSQRLQFASFDDIVLVLALEHTVKCRTGLEAVVFALRQWHLHGRFPIGDPVLAATYGCPLFKEQYEIIARDYAGFSPVEASEMRKIMGRKNPEQLAALEPRFVEGAVRNGQSTESATRHYNYLKNLAEYVSTRSVLEPRAELVYRTAYLVAHFPDIYLPLWRKCSTNK